MLFVLQVLPQLVKHRALLRRLRIAQEDEVDKYAVDDRGILHKTRLDLLEELILPPVLPGRVKDVLHSSINETLKRPLELMVRLGILKLKEVEVSLGLVETEAVDPVVVPAEGNLLNGLLSWDVVSMLAQPRGAATAGTRETRRYR